MNSTLSTAFKEMNLNEKKNRMNKVFSCRFPFSLLSVGATIQTMHEYHPWSSCPIVQMLLTMLTLKHLCGVFIMSSSSDSIFNGL